MLPDLGPQLMIVQLWRLRFVICRKVCCSLAWFIIAMNIGIE